MTVKKRKGSKYYRMRFKYKGIIVQKTTGETTKQRALMVERGEKEALKELIDSASPTRTIKRNITCKHAKRMRLKVAIERILNERHRYNRTYRNSQICYELLLKYVGNVYIDEIDSQHLAKLKDKLLCLGRSTSTINRYLAHLRVLLRTAHLQWMALDKLIHIPSEREPKHRTRVFTKSEEELIIEQLKEFAANCGRGKAHNAVNLVILLFETGMRVGEANQLEFDKHIDLANGMIHLDASITKTNSARSIPMSNRAREVIKRYSDVEGLIFGFKDKYISQLFRKVRKRLGYENDKQFVAHAIRHTFASRLINRGASLYDIKELLGHADISTTQKYAHIDKNRLKGVISLLDDDKQTNRLAQNECIV